MSEVTTSFISLGLNTSILKALTDLGYKQPSPIQIECIPYLLKGLDVLGMAQTGSGKTAAFALPLLHNINYKLNSPQMLVLTPTRELAIQVGEACSNFSKYMKNINVVSLYGGQRYDIQFQSLNKGAQIVVGTPGRLLDHIKRGTLNLSSLKGLVLDEADEMMRMGFIEDVENILKKIPTKHQTALFSATMPETVRRITHRFMTEPKEIYIQSNITTRPNIRQSYWIIQDGIRKSEALVRFLEAEDFDAAIIFVRTKTATIEVAEALEHSGYNIAALNGDMNQSVREQTLERLKNGRLDILIATDVVARGLDVYRISLVVNYDIPINSESYIHRIGRTGRAGRSGRALLFVKNYERRLLRDIERIMKAEIPEVTLPTSEILSSRRLSKFIDKVHNQLKKNDLDVYRALLDKLKKEGNLNLDIEILAAALLRIAQEDRPLILPPDPIINVRPYRELRNYNNRNLEGREMDLYSISIGRNDGVEIQNIVDSISNGIYISKYFFGKINIFSTYSTIEFKKGMTREILSKFARTYILNKQINIKFLGVAHKRSNTFRRISNINNSNFSKKRQEDNSFRYKNTRTNHHSVAPSNVDHHVNYNNQRLKSRDKASCAYSSVDRRKSNIIRNP